MGSDRWSEEGLPPDAHFESVATAAASRAGSLDNGFGFFFFLLLLLLVTTRDFPPAIAPK